MTAPAPIHAGGLRSLVIVLGDQLALDAAAFDGFDDAHDAVWMAEASEESTHVWSTKPRIAIFLTCMRHFADALREQGRPVHYQRLDDPAAAGTLADALQRDIDRLAPSRLVMTAPGEWRVWQAVKAVAAANRLPLDVRPDRHFYTTVRDFAAHMASHQTLRLEWFYREARRKHGVLMQRGKPVGGKWNFDGENRHAFPAKGPGPVPQPTRFPPDAITREVIALVNDRFAEHPGALESFAWPVTREQALQSLAAFIEQRLPDFGHWQDAMWIDEPWLWHSHLSSSLNLKLLDPREVVNAAEAAYHEGRAPLSSVEGFIRQILGWREYVRGVYWTQMPEYVEHNALDAQEDLPPWYWTAETDMACLRDAIGRTLEHGYAHHIQRLMVTGLYPLLLGVKPKQVHEWYLAVYVDAVEWVEMPNTLGMSQFADGGLMASKPYVASGKYIERMSRYCSGCRYDPGQRVGETACPFTTLYWDFLMRHEARMAENHRMGFAVKNLARLSEAEREGIRQRAGAIRRGEVGAPVVSSLAIPPTSGTSRHPSQPDLGSKGTSAEPELDLSPDR